MFDFIRKLGAPVASLMPFAPSCETGSMALAETIALR